MIDHLTDTNVFSEIFKGNADVKKFVESFENSIDTTSARFKKQYSF